VWRIVLDTNVLVAALRSRRGASFAVLSAIGLGRFEHVVSVPLVMEYESVLLRPGVVPLPAQAAQDVVDYLCRTGLPQDVHFLWRPRLQDPRDDMVLEAAVNGRCGAVVTHNVRDFAGSLAFGVQALTPAQFLSHLEEST
jgi:predicted nucleic acid-binding protein